VSVNVAIHAAIDPRAAGGAQTSTVSLVRGLKPHVGAVSATLICPPAVEAALKEVAAPEFRVHAWSHTFPWYRKTEAEENASRSLPVRLVEEAKATLKGLRASRDRDRILKGLGAELLHFPYQVTFDSDLPTIYEPWDLQHIVLPDLFTPGERAWRTALFSRACDRASLVVCATHASKNDFIEYLGIAPEKILVIPRDSRLMQSAPAAVEGDRILAGFGVARNGFLLYPAMTFAHKNHVMLIEALAILRDRHGVRAPLVCSGRKHAPHWPPIEMALTKWDLEDQVRFVGAVSDLELAALFDGARAMVFPSRFEGLGLPLLEAMQYRTPITAARASCIPEVVGDAGFFFNQEDPESIADALLQIWQDASLRARLVGAGEVQRARNSWEHAALTYLSAYRLVAGKPAADGDQARLKAGLATS
jgi:glycosyltransferase involved in cell wall biosynthesis